MHILRFLETIKILPQAGFFLKKNRQHGGQVPYLLETLVTLNELRELQLAISDYGYN
jgi:hypothetical protein